MNALSIEVLRAIAKVLQNAAMSTMADSVDWAFYQDAADSVADLADFLDEQHG